MKYAYLTILFLLFLACGSSFSEKDYNLTYVELINKKVYIPVGFSTINESIDSFTSDSTQVGIALRGWRALLDSLKAASPFKVKDEPISDFYYFDHKAGKHIRIIKAVDFYRDIDEGDSKSYLHKFKSTSIDKLKFATGEEFLYRTIEEKFIKSGETEILKLKLRMLKPAASYLTYYLVFAADSSHTIILVRNESAEDFEEGFVASFN